MVSDSRFFHSYRDRYYALALPSLLHSKLPHAYPVRVAAVPSGAPGSRPSQCDCRLRGREGTEGEDVQFEVTGEAFDYSDMIVICMAHEVQRNSSLRFAKISMHSIFLIVPQPDLIFVISSSAISPWAIRFNSSIFSRCAQVNSNSRRFSLPPTHSCEREVGHSSKTVDSWRKLSLFSGKRMKLLERYGWRVEREFLREGAFAILTFSSCWLSWLTCLAKAWTISKMVMRWRFLTTARRLMGWLQWGQAMCLLASTLMSSCMQGPQQLCWFMHIITGAYSPRSNSPRHRKHSRSTFPRSSDCNYSLSTANYNSCIPCTRQQIILIDPC